MLRHPRTVDKCLELYNHALVTSSVTHLPGPRHRPRRRHRQLWLQAPLASPGKLLARWSCLAGDRRRSGCESGSTANEQLILFS